MKEETEKKKKELEEMKQDSFVGEELKRNDTEVVDGPRVVGAGVEEGKEKEGGKEGEEGEGMRKSQIIMTGEKEKPRKEKAMKEPDSCRCVMM